MKESSSLDEFLTPRISDGVTPIHIAAQYGCVNVMEEFLEKERKVVDVKDTYDQTPLHYATEYGKTDMMELLLKKYVYIYIYSAHPNAVKICSYVFYSSKFAGVLTKKWRTLILTLLF